MSINVTIATKLYIKLFCEKIGKDSFGNLYYQTKNKDYSGKKKRIVMYKGTVEASKIPALWHAWLHYTIDEAPLDQVHYKWEKTHIPNLTGTEYAYMPPGLGKNKREKATGDYEAWTPY